MTARRSDPLLGANDPPPVRITNPDGASSFLFLGDHAGRAIPAALGTLGLGEGDLARHIACDIGVSALGALLAGALDACFIEQYYTRLLVDCNRTETNPEAIPAISDGTAIPGNIGLTDAEKAERIDAIHAPYQAAIADILAQRDAAGRATILVSLHSFTPVMGGFARPWDVGVLHDGGDPRFALALLDRLSARDGIVVGDNEPYRMDDTDHTVPRHAYAALRPYAELEFRQDRLAQDARPWATLLAETLDEAAQVL
ncbi:MAG: N-formylglutamate amidohydrolase [Sphingobium sp.]